MERTAGEACTPFRSLDAARFRETLGTRWIAFEPIGQVRPTIICTQPRTNLGCLSLSRRVFTVLKKKKKILRARLFFCVSSLLRKPHQYPTRGHAPHSGRGRNRDREGDRGGEAR